MPDERQQLLAAYRARRDRAERYQNTWFRQSEAALEVMDRSASVRSLVLQRAAARVGVHTTAVFSVAGRWLPARVDTHRAVVEETVGAATAGDGRPDGGGRHAVLLLGMPGSGKSSHLGVVAGELLARVDPEAPTAVQADAVRARLPEYRDGLGATVVEVEAAAVAYGPLMDELHRRRGPVVVDTVGDPDLSVREVRHLTGAGWSVWCLLATAPPEVAVERVMRRAVTDGRYLPVAYVESIGDRPVRAFDALLASGVELAGAAQFDTDVPEGRPPTVVRSTAEALFGPAGAGTVLWPPASEEGQP